MFVIDSCNVHALKNIIFNNKIMDNNSFTLSQEMFWSFDQKAFGRMALGRHLQSKKGLLTKWPDQPNIALAKCLSTKRFLTKRRGTNMEALESWTEP